MYAGDGSIADGPHPHCISGNGSIFCGKPVRLGVESEEWSKVFVLFCQCTNFLLHIPGRVSLPPIPAALSLIFGTDYDCH
jgi:hypothetical protein